MSIHSKSKILITLLLLLVVSGCSKKQKMTFWAPSYSNIGDIKSISLLRESSLSDTSGYFIEAALREGIATSPSLKLALEKPSLYYHKKLKGFQPVNPEKILSGKEKGILQFSSSFTQKLKRTHRTDIEELEIRDEIKEIEREREVKTRRSIQYLVAELKVTFKLVNGNGKIVLTSRQISRKFKRAGLIQPDTVMVQWTLAKEITRQYLELLTVHQEESFISYLGGGDDYGVTLLQHNAYTKAINHLSEVTQGNQGEPADYYHLGLAWELTGDINAAWGQYQTALQLDPENETIQKAVSRVRKNRQALYGQ